MKPRLELEIGGGRSAFRPGEVLEFSYRLVNDADNTETAEGHSAIEVSVLWYTEGKGDEDFGVHFFERKIDEAKSPLSTSAKYSVKLPYSPMTYDGRILKIRWCVRVKAFAHKGPPSSAEVPFRLVQRVAR